jgi:hypothetical protein
MAGRDAQDDGMAGIVEVERDGMIHRAQYRVEGAVVIVSYGVKTKQAELRHGDDSYAVAQGVLRDILAELYDNA